MGTASRTLARHVAPEARTLGEMFIRRTMASREKAAYYEKRDGHWVQTTWDEFYDRAARIAQGLVALGIEAGDRVSILGPTSGRWACLDMGAQLAGTVSVGIYPMQSVDQLRYLIDHSDSRAIFVEGRQELENILEASRGNPKVVAVIPWDEKLAQEYRARDPRVIPFSRFEQTAIDVRERDARLEQRAWDETAIFIYTSGTTGPPKAAMISHANVLSLLRSNGDAFEVYEEDVSLSFLPMAHAAERILSFYGRTSGGIATYYASSMAAVLDEVLEVRPTLFGGVPRIFEKAYSKIFSEIDKQKPAVRKLFAWATRVGRERVRLWQAGKPIPWPLELQYRIADRLVFARIRAAFGGRVRQFIIGAAPIAIDVLEFFWAAGLPVYEVFGMTEATVVTHGNRQGEVKLGTVGRPLPPFEQRIAEDGELLLRGPWVFRGYFKNEAATRDTIVDGWLHTGDIGVIDADGYLRITDRKKHLIITAGGKNLTPATIENAIKNEDPLISQVHAHGDRRSYISALIAPSPIETLEWGAERGLLDSAEVKARTQELMANPAARSGALNAAMAQVVTHPEFVARIRDAIRRGNRKLSHVEAVRRFYILERDFSQEQGELTPTMKVKRKALETKFAEIFDQVYQGGGFAVEE